jgi:hypothetical protein
MLEANGHINRDVCIYDFRDNEEHRRCITACLIKGTYVLESERTKLREAGDDDTCEEALALAPAWWESFHFRRFRVLACECECVLCQVGRHIVAGRSPRFTYGVIFEYVPPDGPRRHPSAPSYVVAFRGTMRRDATNLGDMRLDLRILLNAHTAAAASAMRARRSANSWTPPCPAAAPPAAAAWCGWRGTRLARRP